MESMRCQMQIWATSYASISPRSVSKETRSWMRGRVAMLYPVTKSRDRGVRCVAVVRANRRAWRER